MSNLAWPQLDVGDFAPQLIASGLQGIEIAPSKIWRDTPFVSANAVRAYARKLNHYGLSVSGVQSLLYGEPSLQVFNRESWPRLVPHLKSMIEIAANLGANIAVFGSPKNRQRGTLKFDEACNIFVELVSFLLPTLIDCGVVLTLEPNAPPYGADFLTTYEETKKVVTSISSPFVRPQIDTGCMKMVDEDYLVAIRDCLPAHVHISAPNLCSPKGLIDDEAIFSALVQSGYNGWVVLEMLFLSSESLQRMFETAEWFGKSYANQV
jgi:D-psicose/D-tagatose/L-ribulose 3-epimerase